MNIVQTEAVWRIASARMPTKWGMFDVIGYERDISNGTQRVETALAIVMGDLTEGGVHSACQALIGWLKNAIFEIELGADFAIGTYRVIERSLSMPIPTAERSCHTQFNVLSLIDPN